MLEISGTYLFNEQVMVVLLEYGYAEKELEKSSDSSYYAFIRYLLEKNESEDIKMCICRVLIRLFNENEKEKIGAFLQEESKRISAQQVVHPIVECYSTGKRALKEVAIDALFNMGLTDNEYIDVMTQKDIHEHILENLYAPHQPLVFKSLRCLLVIIKSVEKLPVLFRDLYELIERLMSLVGSFKESSFHNPFKIPGAEYNIEIKNFAMKILFMIIKKVRTHRDMIKETNERFLFDLCDELKSLFSVDPKNVETQTKTADAAEDEHPDYHVRLTESEKGYCKTILSFIIQYCKDDSSRKMDLGKLLIKFVAERFLLQIYHTQDEIAEMHHADTDAKIVIDEKQWARGILGDKEIEHKFFKLMRSFVSGSEDNTNAQLLKEACLSIIPISERDPQLENGGLFKVYKSICPRDNIAKHAGTLVR